MLFGNKIHLIIEVARNIKLLLIYYAIIQLYMTVQQVNFADLIFFKVSIILVSLNYRFLNQQTLFTIPAIFACAYKDLYAMSGGFFEGNICYICPYIWIVQEIGVDQFVYLRQQKMKNYDMAEINCCTILRRNLLYCKALP